MDASACCPDGRQTGASTNPVKRLGLGAIALCTALVLACAGPEPVSKADPARPPPMSSTSAIDASRRMEAEAYFRHAVAERQAGRAAAAISAARAALNLEPRHRPARNLLIDLYFAGGRFDDIVKRLEPEIETGSADGDTYHRLGSAYLALGRLEAAENALLRAIEREPEHLQAHNNLAALYARSSNVGQSIERLEWVLRLDSTLVVALANLSKAYLENGQHDQAERRLQQLLELEPGHAGGLYYSAVLCNDQGRYDDAVAFLQRLPVHIQRPAAVHLELARAYEGLNRSAEAIQHLERATELDPAYTDALYRLGQVLARQGDREGSGEVLRTFQLWQQRARENPHLWRQITFHREALATSQASDWAHYALGRLYAGQGWHDAAVREYRAAVAFNPDHLNAWRQLGRLSLQARQADDAARAYEHIVALAPEDASAWNNLSAAYLASQRLDDAERALHRALDIAPGAVGLHYNLGLLYHQRGALHEALAAYRQALHLQPRNPRIRQAIDRLEDELADRFD